MGWQASPPFSGEETEKSVTHAESHSLQAAGQGFELRPPGSRVCACTTAPSCLDEIGYSQRANQPDVWATHCTLAWTRLTVNRVPAAIYSVPSKCSANFTPTPALSNPSRVVASFLLWRPGNLGRKGWRDWAQPGGHGELGKTPPQD